MTIVILSCLIVLIFSFFLEDYQDDIEKTLKQQEKILKG